MADEPWLEPLRWIWGGDAAYVDNAVDPPHLEVDGPLDAAVHVLLGPDGGVLRTWEDRPPFGFTRDRYA